MISPHGQLRVYVSTRPVDFRKSIDGLALAVQEVIGGDPFSGAAFVFRAKRAIRVENLIWDGTGMVFGAVFEPVAYALLTPEAPRRRDVSSGRSPSVSNALRRDGSSQDDHEDVASSAVGPERRSFRNIPSAESDGIPDRGGERAATRWMRELDDAPLGAVAGNGRSSAEQAELVALRKEVVRLKAERDIVEEGVAIVCHRYEDNGRAGS